MNAEILIYAIRKGETERYTEDLISSRAKTRADIEKVKAAAVADGYHSFRIAYYTGQRPDFTKAINQ